MKILHIITGLGDGGAEAVLYRLCTYDDSTEHIVVSLMGHGKYGAVLAQKGVEVHAMGMNSGKLSFSALFKIRTLIKAIQPDVVQGWMYHGNIVASITNFGVKKSRLYWGVHHSQIDKSAMSKGTLAVVLLLSVISKWSPSRIIYCANSAKESHENLRFKQEKSIVVQNGYDLELFSPSRELGSLVRTDLNVTETALLLGFVARWHPDKDHNSLFAATSSVLQTFPDVRLILVGEGMDKNNAELIDSLKRFGIRECCVLLGRRDDVPAIMNAIDLHVLSSSSEAFPNVVAEAMACGTPCVATNVGDVAEIIGDTGWVVPRSDPDALAEAIVEGLTSAQEPGFNAKRVEVRERILSRFSVESMISAYHRTWILD